MLELHPRSEKHDAPRVVDPATERHHGETLVTILWRYRWLVASFLILGAALGVVINHHKPITYRATTKLMFKSDMPLGLDATTGMIRGGVPSGGLMQSLINSDVIVGRVRSDPKLKEVRQLASMSGNEIGHLIRDAIRFQVLTDWKDSRDRMIATLHFDGEDPQVCVAAVDSVSRAIEEHFRQERESSIDQFEKLIGKAQKKLLPQQQDLESRYQDFRQSALLEWDADGKALNPYREKQFQLQAYRDRLEQTRRELDSKLRFATSLNNRHNNPLQVAKIIGELNDFFRDSTSDSHSGFDSDATGDLELKRIEIEKTLVPLEIKRKQLELAYGSAHPEVRSIALQIEGSLDLLNDLNAKAMARKSHLNQSSQIAGTVAEINKSTQAFAREEVDAYLHALSERLRVISDDVTRLDGQIQAEKRAADQLKMVEEEDASFRRRIESVQGMLIQLEQQLAALDLVDLNGGIIVEKLVHAARANVTGPNLKKDMSIYGLLGITIGGLLAMMLEVCAKTFRSADEIQRELRLPVLTHIPVDEGGGGIGKSIRNPLHMRLDPKLSVIHRPYSPAAESVRGVRTAMLLDRKQHGSKVYQITSPLPGDGKSTLAANVGCSIAQSGKRTLLIDLDLRSPRLSLRFNLETKIGPGERAQWRTRSRRCDSPQRDRSSGYPALRTAALKSCRSVDVGRIGRDLSMGAGTL